MTCFLDSVVMSCSCFAVFASDCLICFISSETLPTLSVFSLSGKQLGVDAAMIPHGAIASANVQCSEAPTARSLLIRHEFSSCKADFSVFKSRDYYQSSNPLPTNLKIDLYQLVVTATRSVKCQFPFDWSEVQDSLFLQRILPHRSE